MGFVLGVLIAQGLLGKSAMSLGLKGVIVNIPQFTFLLLDQPPKALCPPPPRRSSAWSPTHTSVQLVAG